MDQVKNSLKYPIELKNLLEEALYQVSFVKELICEISKQEVIDTFHNISHPQH